MGEVEDKIWNLNPVIWFINEQKGFIHNKKLLTYHSSTTFMTFYEEEMFISSSRFSEVDFAIMDDEGFGLGQINFRFLSRVGLIPH